MTQKNWIYTILSVSLGANFFLAGYLVGQKPKSPHDVKSAEEQPLKGILKELPVLSQKQLAPMIKNSKETSLNNKRELHLARKKLFELMSTPELNKKAIKETMDTMQRLSSDNLEISQALLYEAITHASFENRLKMVDAMKRKAHRSHRRKAE